MVFYVRKAKRMIYFSQDEMKKTMHGDVILAQPLGMDRKGRREGRVVRVLEPRNSQIVGAILLSQVWDLWYLTIAV